jgi:hypothetical protein
MSASNNERAAQRRRVEGGYSANIGAIGGAFISNSNNNNNRNVVPTRVQNVYSEQNVRTELNIPRLTGLLPFQRSALSRVKEVILGNQFVTTCFSASNNRNVNHRVTPRGQLFWLETGAGKTTIGSGIVLSHLLSISGEYPLQIIVLSNQANKKINSKEVYESQMRKHYAPWLRGRNPKKLLNNVEFWSYQQMWNALFKKTSTRESFRKGIKNRSVQYVIIIDEIHDLVSTGAGPVERRIAKELIEKGSEPLLNQTSSPLFTVYGMTSTPGDTIGEFAKILAIVGPHIPRSFPGNANRSLMNYRINGFEKMLELVNGSDRVKSECTKRLIMDHIVFRRNRNAMVNNSNRSIYPTIKEKHHVVPYDDLLYLMSVEALGRDTSATLYKMKNYYHSKQRNIQQTPSKKENQVSTHISKQGKRKRTYINPDGISEVDPQSMRWLDHYLRHNMYVSASELSKFIPEFPSPPSDEFMNSKAKKKELKKALERFFPEEEGKYIIINLKKSKLVDTGRLNANGEKIKQTVRIPRYYIVPTKGKLAKLVQDVVARYPGKKNNSTSPVKGRKIVYFKDPCAAEIFAHLLVTTPLKGSGGFVPFKNITDTIDTMSSVDVLFKRVVNDVSRNNILKSGNSDDIYKFLNRARKRLPAFSRTSERQFVLASGTKANTIVKKSSELMDTASELQQLLEPLETVLASRTLNATQQSRARELVKMIKQYNLLGERLELIILGGGNLYQGLNIRGLQDVFIVDEFHKPLQLQQMMGRASRGFGHHMYPDETNRVTTIHTYSYEKSHPVIISQNRGALVSKINNITNIAQLQPRLRMSLMKRMPLSKILDKQQPTDKELIKYNNEINNRVQNIIHGMQFLHHHHLEFNKAMNHTNVTLNKTITAYRQHHPNFVKMRSVQNSLKNIAHTQRLGNNHYPPRRGT